MLISSSSNVEKTASLHLITSENLADSWEGVIKGSVDYAMHYTIKYIF